MSSQLGYNLEINFPDQQPHNIPINSKLTIGGSDKSELCIEDYGLAPLHLSLRVHNGILSLHNLGGSKPTILGDQELNHGKMYLLDLEDTIKIGDIEIKVLEGIEELSPTIPEEPKQVQDDSTAPEMKFQELSDLEEEPSDQEDLEDEEYEEEEFEDYEDEEEEQVEKGPNFFQRLKEKLARKKEVKDPRKLDIKKKVKKAIPQAPGPFVRLFALLSNIAIAATLSREIFPMLSLDSKVQALYEPYLPKLDKMITQVDLSSFHTYIQFILCYLVLELTTPLLFGVNLGQFILGFRSRSNFIMSRIKGLLRGFIGLFTIGAPILDFPCVLGKRTFKEFITGSKLESSSKSYRVLVCIFIFPLLLLSPLYTPILLNLDSFSTIQVVENDKVNIKKDLRIKHSWPSKSLGIHIKGRWDKSFEIIPHSKNVSAIKVFNTQNINEVAIQKKNEMKLREITSPLPGKSALFRYQYKDLFNYSSSKKKTILSNYAMNDLKKILLSSLSLNLESLPDLIINHGPVVTDLFYLKDKLIHLLNIKDSSIISYYSTDKKLVFYSLSSTSKFKIMDILLITSNGMIQQYKAKSPKKMTKYFKKVTSLIFQTSSPIKDTDSESSWDWTKVSNVLTHNSNKKKDLTDLEVSSIYDFYFNHSSRFLENGIKNPKVGPTAMWFSDEINQTSILLGKFGDSEKLALFQELSSSLSKLSSALKEKKLDYFSLGE